MTTFNITPSQTVVPASAQSLMNGRVPATIEAVVDFASGVVTTPTGVTALSGASGTVVNALNVPAGFAVLGTGVEVLLADTAGNSGTVQVKVAAASQGSAVTVASLGFVASGGTMTPVVASGSNALLSLTVGTGTINAVVRVFATLLDQRSKGIEAVFIGTSTNPAGQATGYAVSAPLKYTGSNALTAVA